MPKVDFDIAPVSVSGSRRNTLDPQRVALYEAVVDAVVGDDTESSFVGNSRMAINLLNSSVANEEPAKFRKAVASAVETAARANTTCLLDLTGLEATRGVGQTEAAIAIDDVLVLGERQVVLLVDTYPPEQDPMRVVVENHAEALTLVARDGSVSTNGGDISPVVFAAMQRLTAAPMDSLRSKLLRVPGWFPRSYGDEKAYGRNWYSGEFVHREIHELLHQEFDQSPPDCFILAPAESDWLESPAFALGSDLDVPVWHMKDAQNELAALSEELGRPLDAVLLLPIIDSGGTVTDACRVLNDVVAVRQVRLLTILSTQGRLSSMGTRLLQNGAEARYLVRVTQDVVNENDEACHVVTRGVPSTVYSGTARELDVYEFWDLVTLCGTREEENIPPHRTTAGSVPDIEKMVREYGPWLATRLMNVAKREARVDTNSMLVVAPAEPNSELILDSLQLIHDVSTVAVPRKPWLVHGSVSNLGEEGVASIEMQLLEAGDEPWLRQLRQDDQATIVVLDEFTKTGSTLAQLAELVAAATGRNPKLGLVILDLRPEAPPSDGARMRTCGLYRLPTRAVR